MLLKKIFGMILVMAFAILIVGLFALKPISILNQKNGFSRTFMKPKPIIEGVTDRPNELKSVVGLNDKLIYFDLKTPGKIMRMDNNLKSHVIVDLGLSFKNENTEGFSTFIDSNLIYLFLGNSHKIISADLSTRKSDTFLFAYSNFTRSVPISPHSAIIRVIENNSGVTDQRLAKINMTTGAINFDDKAMEKRGDAGISNDGMLTYDRKGQKIYYVYYYKNGFLALDTNLNLVYNGKTIDTLYSYQTSAGLIEGNDELTSTTPSRFVNKASCIDNGVLYILSGIKSDLENLGDFRRNIVIDKYDLETGSYMGSLRLPKFQGESAAQFKINKDKVIILFEKHIVVYKLNEQ